jgi:ABC-type transporter Mla subunit MlaD
MNQAHKALSSVYEQALAEARKLLQYALDHYDEAACDDPERLTQILDGRDEIINTLAALDEQAALLQQGLSGNGQALPESLRALKGDVLKTLAAVKERDEAFAAVIRKSLEQLKSLTLKARDMKKLARFIGEVPQSGETIDYSR